jgi:alkanesulfonate monooxygenase SsuD/methylene tetrahydromethanopterin reductase-like flavin-dependent oxidoreductase (luciferase family)
LDVAILVEGQEGLNWPRWQRMVAAVERLGFSGLFRSDHFVNPFPVEMDALELWVSLAWQADHSKRIDMGPLVAPVSFRHPVEILSAAAAIQELSGGRLVLGLGAGWQEREHRMFGFDLLDVEGRFARLEEALQILTLCLQHEKRRAYRGRHFQVSPDEMPRFPHGLRILLGGNGPRRTLPKAALYADEWNAHWIPPWEFERLNARLDDLVEGAGRPREAVRRSLLQAVVFGADERQLVAKLQRRGQPSDAMRAQGVLYGPPKGVAEQVDTYRKAGVERLILEWRDLDDMDGLAALARVVVG